MKKSISLVTALAGNKTIEKKMRMLLIVKKEGTADWKEIVASMKSLVKGVKFKGFAGIKKDFGFKFTTQIDGEDRLIVYSLVPNGDEYYVRVDERSSEKPALKEVVSEKGGEELIQEFIGGIFEEMRTELPEVSLDDKGRVVLKELPIGSKFAFRQGKKEYTFVSAREDNTAVVRSPKGKETTETVLNWKVYPVAAE